MVIGGAGVAPEHEPLDKLDRDTRIKVRNWLERKQEEEGDSLNQVLLYLVFALAYIFFLQAFVRANVSHEIGESIQKAFEKVPFMRNSVGPSGGQQFTTYRNVRDLPDVNEWLTISVVGAIYGEQGQGISRSGGSPAAVISGSVMAERAVYNPMVPGYFDGVGGAGTGPTRIVPYGQGVAKAGPRSYCLNSWNCLLQGERGLALLTVWEEESSSLAPPSAARLAALEASNCRWVPDRKPAHRSALWGAIFDRIANQERFEAGRTECAIAGTTREAAVAQLSALFDTSLYGPSSLPISSASTTHSLLSLLSRGV